MSFRIGREESPIVRDRLESPKLVHLFGFIFNNIFTFTLTLLLLLTTGLRVFFLSTACPCLVLYALSYHHPPPLLTPPPPTSLPVVHCSSSSGSSLEVRIQVLIPFTVVLYILCSRRSLLTLPASLCCVSSSSLYKASTTLTSASFSSSVLAVESFIARPNLLSIFGSLTLRDLPSVITLLLDCHVISKPVLSAVPFSPTKELQCGCH